jgi:hypothetical protein
VILLSVSFWGKGRKGESKEVKPFGRAGMGRKMLGGGRRRSRKQKQGNGGKMNSKSPSKSLSDFAS